MEALFFYLIALDALGCFFLSWIGSDWYADKFPGLHRVFPLAKGWTTAYFLVVMWLGWSLGRLGILGAFLGD